MMASLAVLPCPAFAEIFVCKISAVLVIFCNIVAMGISSVAMKQLRLQAKLLQNS
jgi:hypothetical protein